MALYLSVHSHLLNAAHSLCFVFSYNWTPECKNFRFIPWLW